MSGQGNFYRPDIDGLRTLAVVPVVLFHAGLAQMPGGFVGVDVFFVISGYLITGILVRDIAAERFSIATFYERRIKRIFPAFLIVCAATTAAALVILPPDRLVAFAKSLAAATLFVSNFFFWRSVDYFATNTHVEPLLHTWSLAVEEQFYVFYPWLLWAATRLRLSLKLLIGAIAAASFVLSVAMVEIAQSAAFYLLPTRAWELAIGGLLAINWISAPRSARTARWAGFAGLALILFAVLFYSKDTPFPGLAAVPPALGAALLIWSGSPRADAPLGGVSLWLARPTMVLIGRASYSFYLWHLPLLAFAAYLYGGILPLGVGLVLAALSLGLALATLFALEDPVRRSRRRAAVFVPSALMILLALGSIALFLSDGLEGRFDSATRFILAAPADKARHPLACMSNGALIVPPARACQLGASNAAPHTLLWGDSHAMVTATAMDASARANGAAFLFAATADCPPGLGFAISPDHATGLSTTRSYRFCARYNREMLARALSDRTIDTVVISSRWSNWRIGEPANPAEGSPDLRLVADDGTVAASKAHNRQIFEHGFFELVRTLREAEKIVFLVGPVPEPEFDVPQRLYVARFGVIAAPPPLTRADFLERHGAALTIIEEAARRYGAKVLRPDALLCRDGTCPLLSGDRPVYLDHNHLSVDAARRIAPLFNRLFAKSATPPPGPTIAR